LDESKQKVEAAVPPTTEPPKTEPPKQEPPPVVIQPVVDMTKFVPKEEFDKVKAHEGNLETSIKQLQDNAKLTDEKVAKATKEAYNKGKMEVIGKMKQVIPDDSQFGYNIQNSTRSLINNIKKKCFEVTREIEQ
jgi:hypothetical protein